MNKIYYYKQEVKIGDKVDLNGHTVTVTEQLVKDLPDKFKVKNEPNSDELERKAAEEYPVGTKFRSLDYDSIIRTVARSNHTLDIDTNTIYCGSTPENEWDKEDFSSNPEIYRDGQWAEIVKPLFTTEDGVEIFKGDTFYSIVNGAIYLLNVCQYSEGCDFKRFSTREAAEEYINKHREKTLEDYENGLFESVSTGDETQNKMNEEYNAFCSYLKVYEPKLYWTKVLQLIADDLNDDWKPDFTGSKCSSVIRRGGEINVHCGRSEGCIYFKSPVVAKKAINIMGNKLDYIFKQ